MLRVSQSCLLILHVGSSCIVCGKAILLYFVKTIAGDTMYILYNLLFILFCSKSLVMDH